MPFLCVKFLINEYRDNSHLLNDWRDRWQERAGSNRKELVVVQLQRAPNHPRKKKKKKSLREFSFGFVFCVTRPWYLLCCGRGTLHKFLAHICMYWLLLSFFSSLDCLSVPPPPPNSCRPIQPSHLSLVCLVSFPYFLFLHFQSRFYGDIPRNYMLISCGLWPRCVLACRGKERERAWAAQSAIPTVLERIFSLLLRPLCVASWADNLLKSRAESRKETKNRKKNTWEIETRKHTHTHTHTHERERERKSNTHLPDGSYPKKKKKTKEMKEIEKKQKSQSSSSAAMYIRENNFQNHVHYWIIIFSPPRNHLKIYYTLYRDS